jgi:hypothetical protein
MPASLDVEPVTKIGRVFTAPKDSLQPGHSQTAAICELVPVMKEAGKSNDDLSVRNLDPASLKKANAEFDG